MRYIPISDPTTYVMYGPEVRPYLLFNACAEISVAADFFHGEDVEGCQIRRWDPAESVAACVLQNRKKLDKVARSETLRRAGGNGTQWYIQWKETLPSYEDMWEFAMVNNLRKNGQCGNVKRKVRGRGGPFRGNSCLDFNPHPTPSILYVNKKQNRTVARRVKIRPKRCPSTLPRVPTMYDRD